MTRLGSTGVDPERLRQELGAADTVIESQLQKDDFWVLCTNEIIREWEKNKEIVEERVGEWIDKTAAAIVRWETTLDLTESQREISMDDSLAEYTKNDWKRRSQQIVTNALLLESKTECVDAGFERNLNSIPPGHNGKATSDCVIFETFLSLAKGIQQGTENSIPVVFLTSNRDDYFEGNTRSKHIVEDLENVGAELATGWREAIAKLGL